MRLTYLVFHVPGTKTNNHIILAVFVAPCFDTNIPVQKIVSQPHLVCTFMHCPKLHSSLKCTAFGVRARPQKRGAFAGPGRPWQVQQLRQVLFCRHSETSTPQYCQTALLGGAPKAPRVILPHILRLPIHKFEQPPPPTNHS